jgi:hypothetical protein
MAAAFIVLWRQLQRVELHLGAGFVQDGVDFWISGSSALLLLLEYW